MPALPPQSDIVATDTDVCFVLKAKHFPFRRLVVLDIVYKLGGQHSFLLATVRITSVVEIAQSRCV